MAIAFHDTDEMAHLGTAAFLHIAPPLPGDEQRYGALFIINARGEPLEFAYNRLELQHPTLWRSIDREQAAIRRLAISLFEAVTLAPSLLICRADAVGPHIFGASGFTLPIPVVRLAPTATLAGYVSCEAQQTIETVDENGECQDVHLFWTPRPPEGPVAELFARLLERGLSLEPFARAQQGIREVYGELWGTQP
ncbi:MAG TPA: hypothetical protein VGL77_10695 [Armatimonadota bacterium]|jgi:hypothetical protein